MRLFLSVNSLIKGYYHISAIIFHNKIAFISFFFFLKMNFVKGTLFYMTMIKKILCIKTINVDRMFSWKGLIFTLMYGFGMIDGFEDIHKYIDYILLLVTFIRKPCQHYFGFRSVRKLNTFLYNLITRCSYHAGEVVGDHIPVQSSTLANGFHAHANGHLLVTGHRHFGHSFVQHPLLQVTMATTFIFDSMANVNVS